MRLVSITAQRPDSTGSGVYLTELLKGFEESGHEQAVVYGTVEGLTYELPESVKQYPVFYKTEKLPFPVAGMSDEMPYESTRYCDLTPEMAAQFANAFKEVIDRMMEEFQPDLIVCHHIYLLASLIRSWYPDVKLFAQCHGSDLRQVQKNPLMRDFIKEQVLKFDGVFALHAEQKKVIEDYYQYPAEKIRLLGVGFNSDIFRVDPQAKVQKDERELRVIFAGKLAHKKGVMSLIRAFGRLPEGEWKYSLSLAGGYGNEQEFAQIKRLIAECPYPVKILGKLTQKELAACTNRSDVFILPSFFEGLPLVLVEAMGCGAPVICTDIPGVQPWIKAQGLGDSAIFVPLPRMKNQDEPIEEDLPVFEQALAEAMLKAKKLPAPDAAKVGNVSWKGLCKRVERFLLEELEGNR